MPTLRSLLALLLLVLSGCPAPGGGTGDDDDSTPLDDDDTPPGDDDDDDDAADDDDTAPGGDACDTTDVTVALNVGAIMGTNNGADDAVLGSCALEVGGLDVVYEFTAPGTADYLISTDHEGTDFDTKLVVFTDCEDPEGSEIACNEDIDEQAQIYTSALTVALSEGDVVYVAVDGYDAAAVGIFELTIEFEDCGDGVVVGSEQCDDGDEDDGDGCDSQCRWECVDDGNEDDDAVLDATLLDADSGPASATGVVCPGDEGDLAGVYLDMYRLDVLAAGSAISATLDVGGVLVDDCADFTLDVFLVDDLLNGYAQTEPGTDVCTTMEALVDPGVYFVVITSDDATQPPQDYRLDVTLLVPECGNSATEPGEGCDDGDQDGGDGCSATCQVEECGNGTLDPDEDCDDGNTDPDDGCSAICEEEVDATCDVVSDVTAAVDGAAVVGDTTGAADAHTPSCTNSASPDAVYELTPASDAWIELSTDSAATAYDTVLSVRDDCTAPGGEIACNDDVDTAAGNYNSALGFSAVAGQTYYVIVDGYADGEGAFELTITAGAAPPAPECGDGEVNAEGEECDDDNEVAGDGCENDCTLTTVCAYDASQDWGVLASGSQSVTLQLDDPQDLPPLACSNSGDAATPDPGAVDGSAVFEVAVAGAYLFEVDYTGFDVQLELRAEDDGCAAVRGCLDLYPNTAGPLWFVLEAGTYRLVGEAWSDDLGGPVAVTITAP
jgi:cysteine-rich repeat protein